MPLLLWVVYPFAVWSACAGLMLDDHAGSNEASED